METAAKLPQAGAPQHSNEHADLDAGGSRDLPAQLNALRSLGKQELRSEWRRLYRSRPPRLSRDLLMRGVAYRVQELAHGGLSKTALRKLAAFARQLEASGQLAPVPERAPLRPGTRLVREWRGRTHSVTVTEDGFEYAGAAYPSLTKIAKKITGAHWSGPRFFGTAMRAASSADRMLPSSSDEGDAADADAGAQPSPSERAASHG